MTTRPRLALAALIALAQPALAQTVADPANIFGLPGGDGTAGIESGTAVIDNSAAVAELVPLRQRFAEFRAAGFPLPDVADLDAYNPETLLEAARLIEGQEDPCTAAADLSMFLNARIADTNLRDSLGTVDRPLWMTTKVLATMTLPDPVGLGGDFTDWLAGLKNRFSRIGPLYNTWQSAEIVKEHWGDTIAVKHGNWAHQVYDEARREDWSAEEIGAEIVNLQAQSNKILAQVDRDTAAFEAAVKAEEDRHGAAGADQDAAYQAKLDAIAEDEATGGERKRREQWLREHADSGEPKPGMGRIIDPMPGPGSVFEPTRNPSEISYEWAITETQPGGAYYREERARALQELQLARLAEKLQYEATLTKLGFDFDLEMEDRLEDLAELQVERETLQGMNLPMANGNCKDIAKPGKVKERLPEIGMETLLALPHDELVNVLGVLKILPPDDMMTCICQRAAYGQMGTTQIYHPDTYGEYDPRYECNKPGPPCIVSGYGCTRNPLPSDPAIWKDCAIGTDVDGMTVPQAIIERLNNGE